MFMDCLTDWLLPGLSTAIQAGLEAGSYLAAVREFNAALAHALKRGLTTPQNSSIIRDILANRTWARWMMEAAGPFTFMAGVWYCFGQEMYAMNQGQCRP
jgi:hypothetical protein